MKNGASKYSIIPRHLISTLKDETPLQNSIPGSAILHCHIHGSNGLALICKGR